ncbi:MAG: FKBP-type peptidyl-prolyl cis-trans isomerase [Lachnospiraceae bacterium]|nr:FKBP-type peptidyl-prolyl cis-trans isomerase [Lachnospiraceae bacterium]
MKKNKNRKKEEILKAEDSTKDEKELKDSEETPEEEDSTENEESTEEESPETAKDEASQDEDESPDSEEGAEDEETSDSEEDTDKEKASDDDEKKEQKKASREKAKNDVSDKEDLAAKRRTIIIELALAGVALLVIVVAIVIKQAQQSKALSENTADPVITAVSGDSAAATEIDNSALFVGIPPVTQPTKNSAVDYVALVAEGKMLDLSADGIEIYVRNYTDTAYFLSETGVSESSIEKAINSQLLSGSLEEVQTDRQVAEMYDTVNIDFLGTMDGVAFDGGEASDYELTIGISAFIDGFTEGIVGMSIGETKDVHVVFPEDYQAAELAGKPAVFAITLNSILHGNKLPELTDALVSEKTSGEYTTVAAYKDFITKSLRSTSIWNFIDADAYVSHIDEDSVIDYYNKTMEQVDAASLSYGMDAESLIGMSTGMDLASFKDQLMNDSVTFIEHSTLYKAIASRENITATQEDIEKVASENGYEGKTDEFIATYGEDMIRDYILEDKLLEFFLDLK